MQPAENRGYELSAMPTSYGQLQSEGELRKSRSQLGV